MTVSKWERGLFAPEEAQLDALEELLGVSKADLRYGDVDKREAMPESRAEGLQSRTMDAREMADVEAKRLLRSHAVRVWIADFRSELTHARADDEEIERAVQLVQRPEVLTFYSRGKVRALTEEDAITALEAIAVPIRAELKRRGRKFS